MAGVLKRLVAGMHPQVAGDGQHTVLAVAEIRVCFRQFRLESFQAGALLKQPKRVIRQLPIGIRVGQDDGSTRLKGRQQAADDRAHPTGINRKGCQSGPDGSGFRAFPDDGKGHICLLSLFSIK